MPNSLSCLTTLKQLVTIIHYEILITLRAASSWLTPLLFFIIVVCLFPIAVGPDSEILRSIAPAIIWIAALLAIILSINTIFRADAEEGYLDLLLQSPHALTLLVFCKTLSHWLMNCLPLILLTPLLGLFLHLNAHEEITLVITLLLGTPVLSLLGAIGSALLVGVRNPGLLLPILMMPLYIPVLIFGTSALFAASNHQPLSAYFAILTAFTLLSLAFAPLLTAAALRIGANQ